MDTSNNGRKNQKLGKTLIKWLRNRDFIDSFRYINPHKKEYTWQKDNLASRINYIQLGEGFQNIIMKAEIIDQDILTGSDYKFVQAEIEINAILQYSKLQRKEGSIPTRRVFLYYKATEESWESYSKHVDAILNTKKTPITKENVQKSEIKINEKWKIISSAILKAAMKYIPWINVKKTEMQARSSVPKCNVYNNSNFYISCKEREIYMIEKNKL